MKKILFCFILPLLTCNAFSTVKIENITGFSLTKNTIQTVDIARTHKPFVVIFLSKDCPCSRANIDYINALSTEFKDFQFIGVHAKKNSKPDEVLAYLNDKKINFEVLNDSDLKIADQFHALKTPHAFIVSKDGEVIYNGGVTNTTNPENAKEHFLRTALNDVQNNRPPSKAETRTLGCFITR